MVDVGQRDVFCTIPTYVGLKWWVSRERARTYLPNKLLRDTVSLNSLALTKLGLEIKWTQWSLHRSDSFVHLFFGVVFSPLGVGTLPDPNMWCAMADALRWPHGSNQIQHLGISRCRRWHDCPAGRIPPRVALPAFVASMVCCCYDDQKVPERLGCHFPHDLSSPPQPTSLSSPWRLT